MNILSFGPGVLFFMLGVIFVLVWGLSLGRTRALISLLAIYIGYVLETTFPYLEYLNNLFNFKTNRVFLKVGLFFVTYIIVFGILNKSLVKVRLSMKETSVFLVGLISMLQLTLLISIIVNMLPVDMLLKVPAHVMFVFSGNQQLFFWSLLPIIAVLFIKKN